MSTGAVTNYSARDTRRAQWVFGIAYGDNYQKAKAILTKILESDPRVLKEPEPMIFLSELNDSSVGINIPFPQMDVHLHQ